MEQLLLILGSAAEISPAGFALRAVLVGIILYLASKILPRRAAGQYAAYDFTFFWMMGGLIAAPLFDPRISFVNTLTALVTIYFLHYAISYLVVKSRSFARMVIGKPIVLVKGGVILRENMRKGLLPLEILRSELRIANAPNMAEVEAAVMETTGRISVLKKADHQPVTPADLQLPVVESGMPLLLINDGEVIKDNLVKLRYDEQWLEQELQKHGVLSPQNVYSASLDGTGKLYYSLKPQTS